MSRLDKEIESVITRLFSMPLEDLLALQKNKKAQEAYSEEQIENRSLERLPNDIIKYEILPYLDCYEALELAKTNFNLYYLIIDVVQSRILNDYCVFEIDMNNNDRYDLVSKITWTQAGWLYFYNKVRTSGFYKFDAISKYIKAKDAYNKTLGRIKELEGTNKGSQEFKTTKSQFEADYKLMIRLQPKAFEAADNIMDELGMTDEPDIYTKREVMYMHEWFGEVKFWHFFILTSDEHKEKITKGYSTMEEFTRTYLSQRRPRTSS